MVEFYVPGTDWGYSHNFPAIHTEWPHPKNHLSPKNQGWVDFLSMKC